MNKITKLFLLPLAFLALTGCNDQTSSSSSTSSGGDILAGQTLNQVLDYFDQSMSVNATYKFFEETSSPRATTIYTRDGSFTTYRNFKDGVENNGFINIDSALAAKKSVDAGVYRWTKSTNPSALVLGNKVGEGTYQDLFHNPAEIKEDKTSYIHNLRHESESEAGSGTVSSSGKDEIKLSDEEKAAKNGNFTLNKIFKDETSEKLLISFAKSLGVYETITGVDGMELNYANIYFGPITASLTVTFYSQYKGGYSLFETSLTVSSFGTAKISELTSYIGD